MVAHIKLGRRGQVALVDDEDYGWLSTWKWYADRQSTGKVYVVRVETRGGQRKISMHRQIMVPGPLVEIDHRNGNTLDNRRSNLRLATRSQNRANIGPSKKSASGYKGVYQEGERWTAQLRRKRLGGFATAEEAAAAYDAAALALYGEFARLNLSENGNREPEAKGCA